MTPEWPGFMRLLDLLAAEAKYRHADTSGFTTVYLVGAASHVLECTLTRRTEDLDVLCEDEVLRATFENPAVHVDQYPTSEVFTPGWKDRATFRPDLSTRDLRVWIQDVHDRLLHKIDRGDKRDFEDFVEVAMTDKNYSSVELKVRAQSLLQVRPRIAVNLVSALRRLRRAIHLIPVHSRTT